MRAATSGPTDRRPSEAVATDPPPEAPGSLRSPSLSVLVTAWRRKRFLAEALRSLERQTLPRDSFEVVVVKDFDDPDIDGQLTRLGARELRFGSDNLGRTMELGVGACRGEVICFLDDDDQFDARKLSVVRTEFRDHPDLGYFHNGLELVDEAGREFGGKYSMARSRALAMSRDWDFCMSCISVRRELVRPLLDRWPEVPKSPDSFLDYMSRASTYARRRTLDPLTQYRVHPHSSSRGTYHAPALLSIARVLRSFPRSPARNAAISSLLGRYMSAALRGRSRDRKSALWAMLHLVTSGAPTEFRPDAREVVCGALIPLSPRIAQWLYGLWRRGEVDWLPAGTFSDASPWGAPVDPAPVGAAWGVPPPSPGPADAPTAPSPVRPRPEEIEGIAVETQARQ